MSQQAKAVITINAPVEFVWKTLVDLEGHKQWNKYFKLELDSTQLGTQGRLVSKGAPIKVGVGIQVSQFQTNKIFGWENSSGIARKLVKGNHYFDLACSGEASTLLTHVETFIGPLSFLTAPVVGKMSELYDRINTDFKAHIEATYAGAQQAAVSSD